MSLRKLPEVRAFQRTDALQFEPPDEAMDKFDASVKAADETDSNVISIYGPIAFDPFSESNNTEKRIAAALRQIGKQEVVVNLNSPGGDFFIGLAIYNLLRAHPAKVTVQIMAMAGSAASVIAMAGDEILMADGSFIMLHNASALVIGNKHDARSVASLLSDVDEAMAEIYSARTGADEKTAMSWMDRNRGDGTFFTAKSAIEKGLADGKLAADKVKVDANAAAHKSDMTDSVAHAMTDYGDLKAALERLRSTISSEKENQ